MGTKDAWGRPFSEAELEAQKVGLHNLQVRLSHTGIQAFSLEFLQEAHRELCGGVGRLSPGLWRTGEITFGSFYGTHPDLIRQELQGMLSWHQTHWEEDVLNENGVMHALKIHAELIRIHPLHDGNGRLSRAIETWLLWQAGELSLIYPDNMVYYKAISRYCLYGDLMPLFHAAEQVG